MTLKSAQIPDTSMFAWNISQRVVILPLFTLLRLRLCDTMHRESLHTEKSLPSLL